MPAIEGGIHERQAAETTADDNDSLVLETHFVEKRLNLYDTITHSPSGEQGSYAFHLGSYSSVAQSTNWRTLPFLHPS